MHISFLSFYRDTYEFRVNLHYVVVRMSRNSLPEAGEISKI